MKYKSHIIYTFLTLVTLTSFVNAQNVVSPPPKPDITNELPPPEPTTKNTIMPIGAPIEPHPTFVGGEAALFDYINKNLKYPAEACSNGVKGTVYIRFIIGKDGTITDAKVLRGIGHGCDEEALRVVNAMPKWIPAERNGEAMQIEYILPIKFK